MVQSLRQIWDVTVSVSNPNVVYVASQSGGVYKSSNGGASWQDLGVLGNANAVAVHSVDANIALAGSPFANEGVFKTVDGGASWTNVKLGSISSLAFDAQDPSVAFAGDTWDGVFKSVDTGDSWYRPDENLYATVTQIEQGEGALYITNTFDNDGIPAHRSQDGGETWEP